MALKFNLGMELVHMVLRHRDKFRSTNIDDDPGESLKVWLSPEAQHVILTELNMQELFNYCEVNRGPEAPPLTRIVGIPVEISRTVHIMDIKDTRPVVRHYTPMEDR
jgi:hypothetical protein